MKKNYIKQVAFTLAEVLITLTIVGIIATLTIPNLMQKWQDHADVEKVKEAYSILSNAFGMAITENGPLDEWNYPEDVNNPSKANCEYFSSIITKYLKISKVCQVRDKRCYGSTGEIYVKQMTDEIGYVRGRNVKSFILENGISIEFSTDSMYENSSVKVDINGLKGPNKMGYDNFFFPYNTSNGFGFHNANTLYTHKGYCNIINPPYGWYKGGTCAYWIIKHGNMDYKYRDVSNEW